MIIKGKMVKKKGCYSFKFRSKLGRILDFFEGRIV